jgi:hypothetical protein
MSVPINNEEMPDAKRLVMHEQRMYWLDQKDKRFAYYRGSPEFGRFDDVANIRHERLENIPKRVHEMLLVDKI